MAKFDVVCGHCHRELVFRMGRWMHLTVTQETIKVPGGMIENINETWNDACIPDWKDDR